MGSERFYLLIDCLGRGGAEKIAVTLANELAGQGCEVHVLILRRNMGYPLDARVKLHVMGEQQFAKGYLHSVWEVVSGFIWARRVLKDIRGDRESVLVSHLTRCNIINIALGLFLPRHRAICVSHNSLGFYQGKGLAKRALLELQRLLFPLAHRTVCVSKRMASDYRQLWAFRKNSILTIYNPVQLPSDVHCGDGAAKSDGAPVQIAMVGRLHPVKRHDLALQAMKILKERGTRPYLLHLLGDGPEEPRIRAMIANLDLADRVVVHGWVEDTSSIVRQCTLSLLSSDTEGFPNSIVESLALGIPVVATDCVSGPRELLAPEQSVDGPIAFRDGIFPGRYGALVPTGDAAAIARAIEYQVQVGNAPARGACADFARQFDAASVARRYANLAAG